MPNLKSSIAAFLHKAGVSANFLTYTGLFCALVSGVFAYFGHLFWASGWLLLSGLLDLLDGAVAREAGQAGKFGGILDSSLDRYGDAFIFGGVLFYFSRSGDGLYAALAFSALVGSFLISYVRARAECEIDSCRVGFWERGERIVYLSLGLVLDNLPVVLWVLAVAPHFTAWKRLCHAAHAAGEDGERVKTLKNSRKTLRYFIQCAVFFLLVLLLRQPF